VEIFFIKDSYGRWSFPKGHQELGETLAETAVREIREETGLDGLQYIAPLGKTSFRFRREGTVIAKSVHYFLFQAASDAKERFATRSEVGEGHELIQEGRWVPMRQAFSTSSYKNSDHLLANAFRLIGGAPRERAATPQAPAPQNPAAPRQGRRRHRRRRWKGRGGDAAPRPPNAPRITF
jgi:ADP-ribose pyrophosphatase YjhB (NUDIX family)